MCPWPRLQGAIWDPEALTVNYRDHRGETRVSAKKAAELRAKGEPAGDCVDCMQCVTVCPIGIDIREGPNFACINCGLCVDACDTTMAKLGRARGLIDYVAWADIERERRKEPARNRVVRPKTVGLGLSAVALVGVMGVGLSMRSDAKVTVIHDRNPVAVRLSDGRTRNGYAVRLYNKADADRSFRVEVSGLAEAAVEVVGEEGPLTVASDATREVRMLVAATESVRRPVTFTATDVASGKTVTAQDVFIPVEGGR
jgi:cytochrome c oxidase accessory protein FixG